MTGDMCLAADRDLTRLATFLSARRVFMCPVHPRSVSFPLCRMSKTTGFATERIKPFPITELDFSGNEIAKEGVAEGAAKPVAD